MGGVSSGTLTLTGMRMDIEIFDILNLKKS